METNLSTSGDSTAASGAAEEQANTPSADIGATASGVDDKGVANSHVEKILKEKRNVIAERNELREKLKQLEENDLLANNKHKEVADLHREENQKLKAELERRDEMLMKAKKISAVKNHLAKMGLKSEHETLALDKLLDVNDLVIDPETNTVLGAEEKAKRFRQEYAGLNIFGNQMTNIDQSAPTGIGGKKSASEMSQEEIKAELKALENMG